MQQVVKKYFTLEQALSILPKVRVLLEKLLKVQLRLRISEGIKIDYKDEFLSSAEIIRRKFEETKQHHEFFKILHKLTKLGVFVKDPSLGLVDFYSKIGNKEIFLCYRYPEETILYWHGLDEGFVGRKSIGLLKDNTTT